MPYCHRLVFAVPLGMKVDDIPHDCGICTYNPEKKTWNFFRRGEVNRTPQFDLETLLAVLYAMDKRNGIFRQSKIATGVLEGKSMDWVDVKKAFGIKVADTLYENKSLLREVDYVRDSNRMLRDAKDRVEAMITSPYTVELGNDYRPYPVHKTVFDALKTLPAAVEHKYHKNRLIIREISQPPVDKIDIYE
jgi:hypothetical protein